MIKTRLFVLVLSLGAGAALAQNTPTGVVKVGLILLGRSESKTSVGGAPAVERMMDMALGGFRSMDYTNYTPPPAPPPPQVTTIGPCTVTAYPIVLGAQSATPIPTTNLDAGPALNLNGPNGIVQLAKVGLGTYSARPPLPGSPMGAGSSSTLEHTQSITEAGERMSGRSWLH